MGQITYENLTKALADAIKEAVALKNKKATTTELGLIMIDGTSITIDEHGKISSTGTATPIANDLVTADANKALSANMGVDLKGFIDDNADTILAHVDKTVLDATGIHGLRVVAGKLEYKDAQDAWQSLTSDVTGVVKSVNGKTPNGAGAVVLVATDIGTLTTSEINVIKHDLEALVGDTKTEIKGYTDTEVGKVESQLTNHSTLAASDVILGHVTVDGTTIIATPEGKISAVIPVQTKPAIKKFTTTTEADVTDKFIYKMPLLLEAEDILEVIYNSTTLDNADYTTVEKDGVTYIKLTVEQSDTMGDNHIYGTIFRGFSTF